MMDSPGSAERFLFENERLSTVPLRCSSCGYWFCNTCCPPQVQTEFIHEKECHISCPNDIGASKCCNYNIIEICKSCGQHIMPDRKEKHYLECPKCPIVCPGCAQRVTGEMHAREEMCLTSQTSGQDNPNGVNSLVDERVRPLQGDVTTRPSGRSGRSHTQSAVVTTLNLNPLERDEDNFVENNQEDIIRQDEHNVSAVVFYSNQRTPEQYKRQVTEMIQKAILTIFERNGQVVRFTVLKQAATTTLEGILKDYLDRPRPPGDIKANSYGDFIQFVFEWIHWDNPESIQSLQQFLMTLEATCTPTIDLTQEIHLVRRLVEVLTPPSVATQSEIDSLAGFPFDLPEHDVHDQEDTPRPDPAPDMPTNAVAHQNEPDAEGAVAISHDARMEDIEAQVDRLLENQKTQDSQIKSVQRQLWPSTVYNDTLEQRCVELERQLSSIKVHISEVELQLQASLASTHNGSFIWRIPELSRRRRDAVDGRTISIYSPPFYTGCHGYKMCIRAYLNGDGMGHNTHLSLFFVIMRGEFDALLKWPFTHKVSFVLVNQNHQKHIVQTFKPTPDSSSFQKPKTDMNVASGCPQFAPLAVLNDDSYVKDDTIYVKCIVDTSNVSHP